MTQFALGLILLTGPNDMALVAGFAKALEDAVIGRHTEHEMPRGDDPRLGEHDRILNGSFVNQHVTVAGVAFGYMLLIAVDQSMRLNNLVAGLTGTAGFGVTLGAA